MKHFCTFLIFCYSVCSTYAQDHLLLSEVALTPTASEFIEIYNPTPNTISLDNYYLADYAEYALLPAVNFTPLSSDMIVRFPAGSSIAPYDVLVIAMDGLNFTTTFSMNADFEVISADPNTVDMIPVIALVSPSITNTGESIILFYWDGISDLVTDVDMINAGVPSAQNQVVSKTGISVDGPDPDTISQTYLNDAATMPLQPAAPGIGVSTKRILLEGPNEIHGGGNGITSDDETSENILITWDVIFTAPTPGISDVVTSIHQPHSREFSVYPNPAVDLINILVNDDFANNNGEIQITNAVGQLVYSNKIKVSSITIQHNFSPGIYSIVFRDNRSSHSVKLAVQN